MSRTARVIGAAVVALLSVASLVAAGLATRVFTYDPKVPLTSCMTFGPLDAYRLEWSIDTTVREVLQLRFTANVQRGYTAMGFTVDSSIQLVSGSPVESLPCMRRLYDNYSPYHVDGNVYAAYPETPANAVFENISHVSHYVMRNLSITARKTLDSGGNLRTNVTLLWGYGIQSMYRASCYNLDVSSITEYALLNVTFTDPYYRAVNGSCPVYNGPISSYLGRPQLKVPPAALLDAEINENTRMAGLLIGGHMLLETGRSAPTFSVPPGFVLAGENYGNVCQSSLSSLRMVWNGFTDPIGGVQYYTVTAGTAARPSLYLDRVNVGTNLGYTFNGLTLTRNETMFISISSFNFAGLSRTVALPPMRILNNFAPIFGVVRDGTVAETSNGAVTIRYIAVTNRLAASWANYTTEDHSAINVTTNVTTENGYDYAVGIFGQAPNSFLNWVSVPGVFNTQLVLTGLTLTHGVRYYITVRTRNCAGVTVTASSPGVTVDVVSPGVGRVFFSNRTYSKTNPNVKRSSLLWVSWTGFSDTTSGIAMYEYAIGKTVKPVNPLTNAGMIVNWTSVGLLTRTPSPLRLTELSPSVQALVPLGTLLYAYVRATDAMGNAAIGASNSTRVVAN
jgi:hypothetical protein